MPTNFGGSRVSYSLGAVGGLTSNGEILKVKNLTGAPSNPIPLVKRSSEQFLFSQLVVWKALLQPSLFTMGISMGKSQKSVFGNKIC